MDNIKSSNTGRLSLQETHHLLLLNLGPFLTGQPSENISKLTPRNAKKRPSSALRVNYNVAFALPFWMTHSPVVPPSSKGCPGLCAVHCSHPSPMEDCLISETLGIFPTGQGDYRLLI
jgi:hypothetical protein